MKNLFLILVITILFVSCNDKKDGEFKPRDFKSVEINTLLKDSLLNVRAIEVNKKGDLSFVSSKGNLGGNVSKGEDERVAISFQLKHDSIVPNFRSLAVTESAGFALSIASPALLYKVDKDSIRLVYKETREKAFYDSMDFWNDQEGIAIGDPTDDCMSIIITRDGGETWHKLSCEILPKVIEGEAAFAASDTNIAIVGDHTWVATGGKASRVLYSPDKGKSWEVYETPIIQGKETTGIYSIDFYDEKNGFGIGGDYTKAADSSANKIRTQDGGRTWQLVAENKSPGYRSCVQYVPNGDGKELVALGFKGIDYSSDSGNSWRHLSDEGFYTIRFLNDSVAYAAGRGRIAKLTFRE